MGDFMDMMGNISNNVCSIIGILRRQNDDDDDFVFKARNPRIDPQEYNFEEQE